ncbi:MAG TPA: hypothetical protein VNC40_03550 [Gaiellaceae bacterium]|nr:hypothetical protein [Gaiellaceae bacterium]
MASKLLGPVRSWEARRALRTARQRADEEILATRLPLPRLAWRTEELLEPSNRIALGRSLADSVHRADERLLPNASPLDRGSVRECRPQLLELAALLCDLDHAVTSRGVLLVQQLLADGSGPLYGHGDPNRLRIALRRCRATLEGLDDGAS